MRGNAGGDYPQPCLISNSCSPGLSGNNNITADPLFVSSSDFRLQAGSPCINKGINFFWMSDPGDLGSKDLAGNPRIVNGVVDMGAFEYNDTPAIPAMPVDILASDGTYTDKVAVSWTASSGATGYQVYRHTENNTNSAEKIASTVST